MPKRKSAKETYTQVADWVKMSRKLRADGFKTKQIASMLEEMRFDRPSDNNWFTIVQHRHLYDNQILRKIRMMDNYERKLGEISERN